MTIYLKLLAFVFGICVDLSQSFGVDYLPYKTKGKLQFENLTHDFGAVKRGQRLRADFNFENVGKGPILIQGVHASCGCTAAQVEKGKVYEPGDKGVIKIEFDTSDFSGKVAKVVTVMTNEAALPARTLTIKADIVADLEASPPLADFGDIRVGQSPQLTIRLQNHSSVSPVIKKLEYDQEIVEAGYARDASGWIINIALKPDLPTGFVREKLIVHNSSALQSEFILPIRANILGHIEQEPRYIEFGALASGQSSERIITLKGDETIPVSQPTVELIINGVKQSDSGRLVSVSLLESQKGKRIYSVKLQSGSDLRGSVHGRVVFGIQSNQQKELPIDLYGVFL